MAINEAVSMTGKIRKTALDGRTTHHAGYAFSLRCRKRTIKAFGWIEAQAELRKVKLRGQAKVEALVTFAAAASNLVGLPKLMTLRAT